MLITTSRQPPAVEGLGAQEVVTPVKVTLVLNVAGSINTAMAVEVDFKHPMFRTDNTSNSNSNISLQVVEEAMDLKMYLKEV